MNILILGGAGFLGSNLVRRCLRDPENRITVVDSLDLRLRSMKENLAEVWASIDFIQGDIRDEELLYKVVENQQIIFNCAAQTSHPLSFSAPLFDAEVNCLGNLKLLEAVRLRSKNSILVYPSSSTVIGRATGDILDETHGEKPLDIYSAHKGVAEKYYRIYNQVYDIKTIVLRFPNLYGPYGKGFPEFGVVNYFIYLASEDEDITVYGNGEQTRNVLFVEDAVEAMYESAFNDRLIGELYFVAHDEHLTVMEIAQGIVTVWGKGRVVSADWPDLRRRIEVEQVRISSARFRESTRWTPRFSLQEGLIKTKQIMERTSG